MNQDVQSKAVEIINNWCLEEKVFSALELKMELRNFFPTENITQFLVNKLLMREYALNNLMHYLVRDVPSQGGVTYKEYYPDPAFSKPGRKWRVITPTGKEHLLLDNSYREVHHKFPHYDIKDINEDIEKVYELSIKKLRKGLVKVKGKSLEEIKDNLSKLLDLMEDQDITWVSEEVSDLAIVKETDDSGPVHYLVNNEWDWYCKSYPLD